MTMLERWVDEGLMAPDWADALASVEGDLGCVWEFLTAETAGGRAWLPAPEHVFAAFRRPLADVRVLLVGQDPYPTPGHPIGLSFAVTADVRPLPRSLVNVYRELESDLAHPPAAHGDLTPWADQGVLLLNRVLTVRAGEAGSHRGRGWERVTERAVAAVVERGGACVALLWGKEARQLRPGLGSMPAVESSHPSPLSARRGFFGSKPFSQVNGLLAEQGADPIDWRLE